MFIWPTLEGASTGKNLHANMQQSPRPLFLQARAPMPVLFYVLRTALVWPCFLLQLEASSRQRALRGLALHSSACSEHQAGEEIRVLVQREQVLSFCGRVLALCLQAAEGGPGGGKGTGHL